MQQWDEFVSSLPKQFKEEGSSWIKGIKLIHFDAQNLYLELEDYFHLNWFEEHIRPLAKTSLRSGSGKPIKLHITLRSQEKKSLPTPPLATPPPAVLFEPSPIDEGKTFDSFMEDASSKIVKELLQEINPQQVSFNPLFLVAPPSSGKTHLLMATCLHLQAKGFKVLYAHAGLFTDQVVQAIRSSSMQAFRALYRNIDFLAVDDVHLFARKAATQEEFFHTFNALHMLGKPILLSSCFAPSDLSEIEPRLISRFEWGITLPFHPLSSELLEKFLDKKLTEHQFPLSQNSRAYLLKHFGDSVANLNKALEALFLGAHLSQKEELTLDDVVSILRGQLKENEETALSYETIIDMVASFFHIKTRDLLGKSQTKEHALPRQIAMYLLREKLHLPYKRIGELFKRDHSTVMSSIKLVEEKSTNNEEEMSDKIKEIHHLLFNIQKKNP